MKSNNSSCINDSGNHFGKLETAGLSLYSGIWKAAIPFLARHKRLAEGLDQRKLKQALPRSDLWIQAASAGEAYLALSILNELTPIKPLRVLVTSNTRQGKEILVRWITKNQGAVKNMKVCVAYFPFDRPTIMQRAVEQTSPKVVVLLESEIWPGLIYALKRKGVKILILNGRINEKSVKRYRLWPSFFKSLSPDRILAVSPKDADRFGLIFGRDKTFAVPNIKFDQIGPSAIRNDVLQSLKDVISVDAAFLVFASVRREEEPFIEKMMAQILEKRPQTVIGLFPRHMHRLDFWKQTLTNGNYTWKLRSDAPDGADPGTVLLWDVFGELGTAYHLARSAFIGGSLIALGGQNFLEPLVCGISPVTGPSWFNFHWTGEKIFNPGLVQMAQNWEQAADLLIKGLDNPVSREQTRRQALEYIKKRQGGTQLACQAILKYLYD